MNKIEEHREFISAGARMTGHSIYDRPPLPPSAPDPTKLHNATSKICPHCWEKYGKKYSRKRVYHRSQPKKWMEIDQSLSIILPSVTVFDSWPDLIRSIFLPSRLVCDSNGQPIRNEIFPLSYPWFECQCIATCPNCKKVDRVHELDYVRQFGPIRRIILSIGDQTMKFRKLIFSHS